MNNNPLKFKLKKTIKTQQPSLGLNIFSFLNSNIYGIEYNTSNDCFRKTSFNTSRHTECHTNKASNQNKLNRTLCECVFVQGYLVRFRLFEISFHSLDKKKNLFV
jgi:hypothetical protein